MDHPIWSVMVDEVHNSLILDCRDEQEKKVTLYRVDIDKMKSKKLSGSTSWWERLVGINNGKLYSIEYLDQQDPTRHVFHQMDRKGKKMAELENAPNLQTTALEAVLYEAESEHHKLVSKFLGLELPISCEYLELEEYIIISYYLRSENDFDRYLLLLKNGTKEWNVLQDHSMKGFSPGAFFVHKKNLIFVKDRNEVCIHPL